MKKLFTLLSVAFSWLLASATSYEGKLQVFINGQQMSSQKAEIVVNAQSDGRYALSLRNFVLETDETQLPVGNVSLKDVDASICGTSNVMHTFQTIQLEPGDDASAGWIGPQLPAVDVDVNAVVNEQNQLNAVISIDATATLGMVIRVLFGSHVYQVANSGFEDFHVAKLYKVKTVDGKYEFDYDSTPVTSDEPDYWHSFMSASGYDKNGVNQLNIVYLAGTAPHTFVSDQTRPGSTGKSSLLLKSSSILGIVANGTVTTGRINAGSINVVADAQGDWLNHSWNDMSQTELGQDGHPFYTRLDGRPDSLAVWVKFAQGDPEKAAGYPYASINAVINDGSYYQDPEPAGVTYTNVLAKANNNEIAVTDGQWKRIVLPFDYASYALNQAKGRVILVTASTNAGAGKGSGNDELYMDDMELIYNCRLSAVSLKGISLSGFSSDKTDYKGITVKGLLSPNDIEVETNGQGAYVIKKVENIIDETSQNPVQARISLIVVSGDLSQSVTYTIVADYDPDSVSAVSMNKTAPSTIYDVQGRQVRSASTPGIYIIKDASGKTIKRYQRR